MTLTPFFLSVFAKFILFLFFSKELLAGHTTSTHRAGTRTKGWPLSPQSRLVSPRTEIRPSSLQHLERHANLAELLQYLGTAAEPVRDSLPSLRLSVAQTRS